MKLSKYFLSAFAFVFAIGGAFASFTGGTFGFVTAIIAGERQAVQAFSPTTCSLQQTSFICTAGSDVNGTQTGQWMYETPAGALQGGVNPDLLYEVRADI